MDKEDIQQAAHYEALVPIADQVKTDSCNMRIDPTKKQKEATYQVVLDILNLSSCYNAFLITVDEILRITPRVSNKEFIKPPPRDALVSFLKLLSLKGSLDLVFEMYIDHMYQPWRIFSTINNKCLSRKVLDIQNQIDNRQTSAKRREIMPIPDLPSKGEGKPMYRMSISDDMMNDDIKNSDAYLTYLALSTGTEVLAKKGRRGKDKGLLGESMSLTRGEIAEEERRVHETYASIVIGREV
ncbi:hypothetical protein Tco_0771721 [Tanacetum coccineum]|uniref:Uncharacterized protein n=1 Tax=Tanacetum coccineum TaxID=301880 RepID=A0ABQ4ZG63_9ASTR